MNNDNSGATPLERELRASIAVTRLDARGVTSVFLTTAAARHLPQPLARVFAASVSADAELGASIREATRSVIRAWQRPRQDDGRAIASRWPGNVNAVALEESMAEAWELATEG
jgi:hypothetical protein